MLSAFILNVNTLSVVMLIVANDAFMLSVIMLSVVMLNVVMLRVVGAQNYDDINIKTQYHNFIHSSMQTQAVLLTYSVTIVTYNHKMLEIGNWGLQKIYGCKIMILTTVVTDNMLHCKLILL
jgi:hypothetical protein